MPYSAGTIVLQVVPSYLGFQEENTKVAKALAKSLDEAMEEGARSGAKKAGKEIDKILGEEVGKSAKQAGSKTADAYLGSFRDRLQKTAAAMERELKPIKLGVDNAHLGKDLERAKKLLADLGAPDAVKVGADTTDLRRKLSAAAALIDRIRNDATIELKGDTDQAMKAAKAFEKYVSGLNPNVSIDMDIAPAERKLGAFEKLLKDRLKRATSALGDGLDNEVRQLNRRLQTLTDKQIGIDLDADTALAELRTIERELAHIAATTTDINVNADVSDALAELKLIDSEVRKLNGQEPKIKPKVETTKAVAQLSLLDKALKKVGIDGRDVANSFRFFSFAALAVTSIGIGLIPILAAISAGIAGIGVAAIAAVAGLGVLVVAFSGIGDAVSALNDAQDKGAKEAQDSAKRMKNAAQQVEDAQRSLRRARENAAEAQEDAERSLTRTVEDAARRNEQAARSVADTREQAARDIEAALKRQEDAEKRVADSQKDAADAQRALTEARAEARKELEDLATQQRRAQLDERQAVIDLFNATVEDTAARQDPGATNLEKEQASINLGNAKLRLEEIRKQQKEIADQQKKGVDGSDKVKTAEGRVTAALEAQKEAQAALAQATKDLNQQRLDSAKAVTDALDEQRRTQLDGEEAISDAIRSRNRVIEDGQDAIADAQRNLTRAQEDYKTALQETSASAQAVKDAMDALGPAGQAFALFIHSLRDDFREIRDIIQTAFLPLLTEAIKTLLEEYGPELKLFVGNMATVFGQLAVFAADTLTSPEWKTFFGMIAEIAPIITKDFGVAFMNFLTAFANIAVALSPLALELSGAFVDMSEAFLEWTRSKEGQKAISDFLAYVREIAPDVKEFLKALAGAIVAIVKAVAPFADDILRGLTSFLEFIANMDPKKLGLIVFGVLTLIATFQALSGIISLVSIIAGSGLGLFALAAFAVVGALIYLYTTSEEFKALIDFIMPIISEAVQLAFGIWKWNMELVAAVLNDLIEVVGWLGTESKRVWDEDVSPVWNDIKDLFSEMGGDIAWVWKYVLWPVLDTFGKIMWNLWNLTVGPVLRAIAKLFGDTWDGIKKVWNDVLKPVFSDIADKLGVDDKGKEKTGGLVGAFRSAVGLIKNIWDGLKNTLKAPVDFFINTIMNGGVIGGFNKLAEYVPGLKPIDPIPWPPPGYANGGIPDRNYGVRFGYSPGRDNQIIAVGGGEAILRPEATRALGPEWVNAINKRAKMHGVQGVSNFLGGFYDGGIPGYKDGGETGRSMDQFKPRQFRGKRFNEYTIRMIEAAERLAQQTLRITQGSFSTSVAASGSTHAGGGALDAGWPGGIVGQALVAAMRMVGFAAWHRDPSQGPWNHHIHAIAAGDPSASPAAKRQVESYYNGGDGLGGKDDGPNVKKDPSLLEKIKGGLGGLVGWVADAISNPVDWLRGRITDKLSQLTNDWGDNALTQTLKSIPEMLIQGMAKMIGLGGSTEEEWTPIGGGLKDMVAKLAQNMFGWGGDQWSAINKIVTAESGWNPTAQNPVSSAYGLFQFLNGTWGPYGVKTSDPQLQARYGLQYIKDRYGDPKKALDFREDHGWYSDGGTVPDNGTMMYDNGGYLPPGITQVVNLTGKPEPVFTADQFEGMKSSSGTGSGVHYEPHFYDSDLTAADVAGDLMFTIRRINQGVLK